MKILAVIFLLLLIRKTVQECLMGCLKCDSNEQCLFCNLNQLYYLKNGSCFQLDDSSCLTIDPSGKCLECKSSFYLDQDQSKCLPISLEIENCIQYATPNSCLVCNTNYYMKNGQCEKVLKPIPNCDIYDLNQNCV